LECLKTRFAQSPAVVLKTPQALLSMTATRALNGCCGVGTVEEARTLATMCDG
jgi:hypothetical protein